MWCVPHVVVAVAFVAVHFWVGQEAGVVKGQLVGRRLASMPWTFASYWRLLFLPVHLATPHARVPLAWSEVGAIAGSAAVAVGVLVAVWWAAPRRAFALFCIGWWFVMLLPFSNLVPLSMLIAERYLYLPILGACAFGADLVWHLAKRRRWLAGTCAAIVLALFAMQTHSRNRVWADTRTFWRDAVSKWPDGPVPRIGLAAAYLDTNAPEAAWAQYMKVAIAGAMAYSRNPEHIELVNVGLMQCYDRVARGREADGRMDEALGVYRTAVRLMPQEAAARVKLAEAFERRGRYAEALEQLGHLRKIDEGYAGLAEWRRRLEAKKAGATP